MQYGHISRGYQQYRLDRHLHHQTSQEQLTSNPLHASSSSHCMLPCQPYNNQNLQKNLIMMQLTNDLYIA